MKNTIVSNEGFVIVYHSSYDNKIDVELIYDDVFISCYTLIVSDIEIQNGYVEDLSITIDQDYAAPDLTKNEIKITEKSFEYINKNDLIIFINSKNIYYDGRFN